MKKQEIRIGETYWIAGGFGKRACMKKVTITGYAGKGWHGVDEDGAYCRVVTAARLHGIASQPNTLRS